MQTRKRLVWILLAVFTVMPSMHAMADPRTAGQAGEPAAPTRRTTDGTAATGGPINYAPLREKLQAFLAGKQARYAIYFEDVITGQSFGINEHERFHAASTIKLPAVLYLNHLAAEGKIDWQTKVAYEPETDWQQGAGALQFFGQSGKGYTLRTLQTLSITLSDNIAYRMLVRHLGKENIAAYMRDLGAEAAYPDGQAITTARDMGLYLRAALDLAEEHPAEGRRLLDDLANTIWDTGLSGRLPDGVTVAHKEGDITGVANDAGIVFGSRPYILVVLSKDQSDIDQGFRDIAEISRLVYDTQERLAGR